MIEFGITVVLVALLAAVVIFLKKRKKCSSCCSSKETPKSESIVPEQVKQQPETKSVDEPVVNESTSVNPQIIDTTVAASVEPEPTNQPVNIEPPAKQQTKETAVSPAENTTSSLLPQDSVLKRHYLAHVCMMIESLVPSRPTDSVLCRHYDAMIAAEIDQCLNDKTAMEQLTHDYENRR